MFCWSRDVCHQPVVISTWEGNHPEEPWISLRQLLAGLYRAAENVFDPFGSPKAGCEALLWEQSSFTLRLNKSYFLGDCTTGAQSWVVFCGSCGQHIYLLVEQGLLWVLRAHSPGGYHWVPVHFTYWVPPNRPSEAFGSSFLMGACLP